MTAASRLTVDPIACDGHGLCADLFPEREAHARRAVSACPVLALRLARRARG